MDSSLDQPRRAGRLVLALAQFVPRVGQTRTLHEILNSAQDLETFVPGRDVPVINQRLRTTSRLTP